MIVRAMNRLPASVRPGLVNYPGRTAQSQRLTEQLLEKDREEHHCYFNRAKFHNHLSHHILAAYDLGAPAPLLQAIYDSEQKMQLPVDMEKEGKTILEIDVVDISEANWVTWLGNSKYYASYLAFFTAQVNAHGSAKAIEKYLFAESANANGAYMLIRMVDGLFHPLIQVGYGVEFGSDAMVAQGLAQTAVTDALSPEVFDPSTDTHAADGQQGPLTLFEILRQVYDSPILKPPMPYDPNALLSKRRIETCKDGRPAEIRRLAALWWAPFTSKSIPAPVSPPEIERKVEELFYLATLLFVGTGKPNRTPRLDFNLMHILTATLFVPSILTVLGSPNKERFLQYMLLAVITQVIMRGRPRVDPVLVMRDYSAVPRPPIFDKGKTDGKDDVVGTGNECINPWPAMVEASIHAPDAHVSKAIRSLFYAAKFYGTTPAGGIPGSHRHVQQGLEETHVGMGRLDGTLFIRAAGVVMDIFGWVTYGKKSGNWDRSCLGYDDAWAGEDEKV